MRIIISEQLLFSIFEIILYVLTLDAFLFQLFYLFAFFKIYRWELFVMEYLILQKIVNFEVTDMKVEKKTVPDYVQNDAKPLKLRKKIKIKKQFQYLISS